MDATKRPVQLSPEDMARAIGMATAAKMMIGRGGKRPSVETLRRWAGKGCWPQGRGDGKPKLVLMTFRLNGELLTLPEWVEAFEGERARLGMSGAVDAVLPGSE
jgi:hypothetical protein